MKKNVIFVSILFLCGLFFMYGKSTPKYIKMMKNKKVNFFDVKKEAEKYFKENGKSKGSGWKQYKRWEDHWEQRLFPTGDRSNLADPVREMDEFFSSAGGGAASIQAGNWVSLGPTDYQDVTGHWSPGLGRINEIVVDPNNSNVIYVGTPSGGLWRTTVGGNSWTPLTDHIPAIGVSCVLIDPTDTDTIYIGTGDKDGYDCWSRGVLKSTDGGATWNTTGMSFVPTDWQVIHDMLMHPNDPDTLFAATYDGLYKSTDGAANWSLVLSGDVDDIEFKPGDPNTMYACTNEVPSPIFYRSTNGGSSWSSTSMTSVRRAQIAVTPANSNYVYYFSGDKGLYRSTNSGVSFSRMGNAPTPGTQDQYDLAMAVSPTNVNEIHVGEIETYVSLNGGSSWTKSSIWLYPNGTGYIHCDIHEMVYFGNTLYIGSDGLITKTTDSASTFTDLSVGLGIRQFYRIGSGVNGNPYKLVGGSQDNGTSVYSTNYWHEWIGADGMECAINYKNENIIYGCIQNGQFYKSTNGGANEVNITQPGSGDWVTPFVMHPVSPDTLYVGNNYVRKTTDGMSSWTTIGNFGSGNVNAIAVAKSNPNYIYAAKDDRLWRTNNGGGSWTEITGTLPGYFVTYISVHPSDPLKVAVTLSSFWTYADGEKVFKSDNGGNTWINYSGNLPNLPANCVAYHGGTDDAMYVGMDMGIYYRDNTKSNWEAFMTNLPNVMIKELEIDDSIGKIRAATYGRGLWEASVYGGGIPGGYCTASHDPAYENEMITRVQVGSIDKSSAWATYSDFTSLSTDMEIGSGYPFTASVNASWASGSKFGIWIDWNGDEDFEDAGEEVYTYSGEGPYSTTITPPAGASLGTTRMRVRMFWQVTPTPCGDLLSGEVEDYTVNITEAPSPSGYCTASHNTQNEMITRVQVGSIDKSSAWATYSDFTSESTDMEIGSGYAFTASVNYSWAGGSKFGVWIDWNGDEDFDDAGEEVYTYSGEGPYSTTITPPAGASLGTTRMRVRMFWQVTPTPCGALVSGEVEDYTVNIIDAPPSGYCTASHNTQNEMITRVQVGSIDKSSAWATYSDFTSESTDMEIGSGYAFTASVNYSWAGGSKFGVWIDWNRDGDFSDAGEEVYTYVGVGPYSTTITPPAGASLGTTRMRVRMFWQVTPTPCGALVSGEVEDYTVNITDN